MGTNPEGEIQLGSQFSADQIIIHQTGTGVLGSLVNLLKFEGIIRDVDYLGFENPGEGLEKAIRPGRQLLITGTIEYVERRHLPYNTAQEMIHHFREINPELVVVLYSAFKHLHGDFDLRLEKRMAKLAEAIREFRAGRLNRVPKK